jgi:hypothetical protein
MSKGDFKSRREVRRVAYSMLLTKGLVRVGIGIPDGAEFELVAVDDPYGYASARELSLMEMTAMKPLEHPRFTSYLIALVLVSAASAGLVGWRGTL